jgi:hypothetical protein
MHGRRGLQLRRSARVISLIVPCWKDEEHAIEFAEKWANHPLIREVIVAAVWDQSHLRQPNGKIRRCHSDRPSRGLQLNLGAKIATGQILLFHHVDSILTEEHLQSLVNSMRDPDLVGGAFYRKFDGRHPHLRWLERFERWHCRAFGTIYGDQSVFVRRNHFRSIGGFETHSFNGRRRALRKITALWSNQVTRSADGKLCPKTNRTRLMERDDAQLAFPDPVSVRHRSGTVARMVLWTRRRHCAAIMSASTNLMFPCHWLLMLIRAEEPHAGAPENTANVNPHDVGQEN